MNHFIKWILYSITKVKIRRLPYLTLIHAFKNLQSYSVILGVQRGFHLSKEKNNIWAYLYALINVINKYSLKKLVTENDSIDINRNKRETNDFSTDKHPNSVQTPDEIYFVPHAESARLQKTSYTTHAESLYFVYVRYTRKINPSSPAIKMVKIT